MSQLKLVKIEKDGKVTGISHEGLIVDVLSSTAQMYKNGGYHEPWLGYLAMLDGSCVGTCAFKSAPEDGRVEIACFTFPEFEGRGVATQMTQQLIDMALSKDRDLTIAAQTPPAMGASTKVLEKQGFELVGLVGHEQDGEVWEWVLKRSYH
jgi:[ribosomal protein S5]-alanine N-acetyltransferase